MFLGMVQSLRRLIDTDSVLHVLDLFLLDLRPLDTQLNRQDRPIERRHGQSKAAQNPRLPSFHEPLFSKHRSEIIHVPAENCQHSRRAA